MSSNNVIPFEVLAGGLWKTSCVDTVPEIEIVRWMVVEMTPGNTRHLVGYNITEREGRTSSRILHFDKPTMVVTTNSGRKYKLVGEPGADGDAIYVLTSWCRYNNITSYTDVTEEYYETPSQE
jgi:hypothetical protein